jgi:hypothetical protein
LGPLATGKDEPPTPPFDHATAKPAEEEELAGASAALVLVSDELTLFRLIVTNLWKPPAAAALALRRGGSRRRAPAESRPEKLGYSGAPELVVGPKPVGVGSAESEDVFVANEVFRNRKSLVGDVSADVFVVVLSTSTS